MGIREMAHLTGLVSIRLGTADFPQRLRIDHAQIHQQQLLRRRHEERALWRSFHSRSSTKSGASGEKGCRSRVEALEEADGGGGGGSLRKGEGGRGGVWRRSGVSEHPL